MNIDPLLYKSFSAFGGIDLRVSDLLRDKESATEAINMDYRDSGAIGKVTGKKTLTRGSPSIGVRSFSTLDPVTNVSSEELIGATDKLLRVVKKNLTITYSGSGSATCSLEFNVTDSEYKFYLYVDGTAVLTYSLGNGKESSFITLANLITAINAVANFTSSASGITTEPAAFLPNIDNQAVASTGSTFPYYYWETVRNPNTGADPFDTTIASYRNNDDFSGLSFARKNQVLYIASPGDPFAKYDGKRVYKAGLPSPSAPTITSTGAGGLTGTFKWKITYDYVDHQGNIIASALSSELTDTLAAEQQVLSIPTLATTSGYNTDFALCSGGLGVAGNTITVDSGHNILEKDVVVFFDTSSSTYVQRRVTATTATTITVDGATVTLAASSYIAAGLTVTLWRTKNGGSVYYLVKEFANTPGAAIAYTDNTADSALGAEYVDPVVPITPPPMISKIDLWQGKIVATADASSPNTLYWEDIAQPESFPTDLTVEIEDADSGTNVTLKSLDNVLYIFKEESITGITGELDSGSFRVDTISREGIGCIAAGTVQVVNGFIFFLSRQGPYALSPQGSLEEVGAKISPKFDVGQPWSLRQARGFRWNAADKYMLQLPVIEEGAGSQNYVTSDSRVFVFDVYRKAWLEWTIYDFQAGAATFEDLLWTVAWELDETSGAPIFYSYRTLENGNNTDFINHDSAINFSYATNWESLGEPSVFKKFLRLKLQALDDGSTDFQGSSFTATVEAEYDYNPLVISSITLDFSGGEGWGESGWGEFGWGEVRLRSKKHKLAQRKAKSMRLRFKNETIMENLLISGFELEIAPPYRPRIKE